MPTDSALMVVASACAPYYNRSARELVEAFKRCASIEFYDLNDQVRIYLSFNKN